MDAFKIAQDFVAKWEGGLTDHPADPGGITNYGLSLRFLQDIAISGRAKADALERIGVIFPINSDAIRKLTPDIARAIFKWWFWEAMRLYELPPLTAIATYDAAVNTGRGQSCKFLQRACNSFEATGIGLASSGAQGASGGVSHSTYDKLDVDGLIGPKTRARALALLKSDSVLAESCLAERDRFYRDLAAAKPNYQAFLAGWLNRSKDLRRLIAGEAGRAQEVSA